MAAKMKGFCKSFKIISQIFVVKEKEIEIGFPTDIQHVAHIGWDGSGTPPSWMSEYKSAPDFLTSLGSIGESGDNSSIPRSTWSSQDFEQILMAPPTGEVFKDQVPPGIPNPKKKTRKKNSSTSSSSSSSSSSKSSLLSKERFHF